jgi:hypothetical protein
VKLAASQSTFIFGCNLQFITHVVATNIIEPTGIRINRKKYVNVAELERKTGGNLTKS